jgi:signal transduction histidine kinase
MAATAHLGEGDAVGTRARASLSTSRSSRLLAAGVIAAALGVTGFGLASGRLAGISLIELGTWVAVVVLAGLLPVSTGEGLFLCVDLPLLLAVAFLHGPLVSGLIALAGTTDFDEIRGRVSILRSLFNRSQVALSITAAGLAFQLVGGRLGYWPWTAVAGLCAVTADVAVNYSIIALYTAFSTGRSFTRSVLRMRLGPPSTFIPMYLSFGFLGLLLSETYLRLGAAAAIGFLAPVVVARQMFMYGHRLEGATRALLSRNKALRNVDARIAQERTEERAHLAAALNEEVLQSLYGLTLRSRVIKEDLNGGHLLDLDRHVPELLTSGEVAVASLRRLVRDLTKSPIGHAGLAETLMLLIRQLQEESLIRFTSHVQAEIAADADVQFGTFLIAKEALNNAVRHAAAEAIDVTLEQAGGGLRLVVADDGVGFETHDPSLASHYGVDGMKQRAAEMGGRVEIRSRLGGGTTVVVVVPADIR